MPPSNHESNPMIDWIREDMRRLESKVDTLAENQNKLFPALEQHLKDEKEAKNNWFGFSLQMLGAMIMGALGYLATKLGFK